jgi:hypothetical protein
MDVALRHLDVMHTVRQHHDAARREHDVIVERLGQRLPHFQRVIVKSRALAEQIIGPNDGGIPSGVAAADPPLLEHGDIRKSMLPREVVRRTEAMAAAAHDHRVIRWLGVGLAPLWLPATVTGQTTPDQSQRRKRLPAHPVRP